MEKLNAASIIIQEGNGGIEVVSKLNSSSDVVSINVEKKNGLMGSQYGVFLSLSTVVKILKKYDCVMTNLPMHHIFFSMINIFYKKKHIAIEHGPWVFAIGMKSNILVSWFYHFWLKHSKVKILCVSKDLYCMYNLVRKNNVYIPNCIAKIESVKTTSLLSDEIRCVFIGRFDQQKDVELAISSFLEFSSTCSLQTSFELFGSGIELDILTKKYKNEESIKFMGYSSDARNQLVNYDICIVSSKFEGLPGIVLEALYVGCRVVSAPFLTGLLELAEYPNLRISSSRDYKDLSIEMNAVLNQNFEPAEIREKLLRVYSQKCVSDSYMRLILSESRGEE